MSEGIISCDNKEFWELYKKDSLEAVNCLTIQIKRLADNLVDCINAMDKIKLISEHACKVCGKKRNPEDTQCLICDANRIIKLIENTEEQRLKRG